MTTTPTDDHRPEPWFHEAGSDDCPHGPEPENEMSPEWEAWEEATSGRHTGSPQDVRIGLDAPAGDACAECSAENNEFVPWTACRTRPRRKDKPMPEQPTSHQPETVIGGDLECLERECEDFFTDDGDEIPGKETCSHLTEMEICTGCSGPATEDFAPVTAWVDCPHRAAPAAPAV